ncbi:MAG: hypothetical protein E6Q34_06120 [Burkholderiaceae bacterium]|nr:MAG: hypothetical protein E6Q34_06120 [Burkholderiaceae bacterium]
MKSSRLFTILSCALLLCVSVYSTQARTASKSALPAEHQRGLEQTLLTFPEWFLVFSPHEYASFIAHERASDFPFYGHIGQFWQSYRAVSKEASAQNLNPNPGYHLMVMVIGVSTTVEYALKSAYETLIGRLTEASASGPTEEDHYAAKVARDYVDFIRIYPWYEYAYADKLKGLWHETSWSGNNMLRKWERKFALSTEYLAKMIYAKMIMLGTKSIYDAPLQMTGVVTDKAPTIDPQLPHLKVLSQLESGQSVIVIPRYEAFTTYSRNLAKQGLNFEDIAGNREFILVSVLATKNWKPANNSRLLFSQVILTQPDQQRFALLVPVNQLATSLRDWDLAQVEVEHVFDY